MDKGKIKAYINQLHPLEDEVLDEYLSHWKPFEARKKSLLTRAGEVERYMYFVLEGIQKSYRLKDGKMHVIAFTYAPSISGIPGSFFTQQPSLYFLENLTDSKFLRISKEQHEALMAKHRSIETLFRKATELVLAGIINRYYELMAHDIETRFKVFVQRSPHLLQMVPQKDLASYLRIDPTNFSKLMGTVRI